MKTKLTLLAFASLAASAMGQNLITNGSFELGNTNVIPSYGYADLAAGDTSISGWSIGGSTGVTWLTQSPGGFNAQAGNYSLDLTAQSGGQIWTDFATTAGNSYTLSFYSGTLSGAWANGNVLVTDIGSSSNLLSQSIVAPSGGYGSMPWSQSTYSFTATGASTRLLFGSSAPNGTPFGPVVDNVSVTLQAVPEPSSVLISGLGLLGLTFRRRRG